MPAQILYARYAPSAQKFAATRVFRREHVATSGEAFVTMDAYSIKVLPDRCTRKARSCRIMFSCSRGWEPLKGFTANQAKKALGFRDSAFWWIQRYSELNPVKAGFRWSSAGFGDELGLAAK